MTGIRKLFPPFMEGFPEPEATAGKAKEKIRPLNDLTEKKQPGGEPDGTGICPRQEVIQKE